MLNNGYLLRPGISNGWMFCFFIISTVALQAFAGEFTVTQISDDKMTHRDPTISETGQAAWSALYSDDKEQMASKLVLYSEGKTKAVTDGIFEPTTANLRPQAQGHSVVWVSTIGDIDGTVDWILREVPNRDETYPELNAIYDVRVESNGVQVFEVPSTNPRPVAVLQEPNPTNGPATPSVVPATNAPVAPQPAPAVPLPPEATSEVRRADMGNTEICMWDGEKIDRLTHDRRDDLGPSFWGDLVAWQKGKGWPFGWEIMVWDKGTQKQLTTNFYYDMAPKVQGDQVTWYGWDGRDFEIFMYDRKTTVITQITSNQYDDVSPAIWDGAIAWESYPGVDAEIYLWKDGEIQKLSDNIEDDVNPRIWNGQVVWQGFDGDDFEIYLYDGAKTIKLTSNTFDDLNPDIRDNVICWMGYHDNWDAEIYAWDGQDVKRLTDNELEDRDPKTAGGRVIWQTDLGTRSVIYLAEPKK